MSTKDRGWLGAMRHGWRAVDRRPIYEWAAEHVNIPQGVYTGSGYFDVSRSRYLIEPFVALQSDVVRKVTVQAPTRSGKSLLADIWLMWLIAQSSGPTMWNFNTDPQARKHFRTRLLPLMLGTRLLAELLPEDARKLTQEVIFRDGVPLYVQGPSLDNLQGVGICNLIEDELWRREAGRHDQALSRLGDYARLGMDKNLNIGQGGFTGDDQDLEFTAGSQEEWLGACLHCGHWQEPVFTGYRKDGSRWGMVFGDKPECKDRHGDWVISKVAGTVRWACEKCGGEHADQARTQAQWNLGKYVARNPEARAEVRSFHLGAVMVKPWVDLVIKFCLAQNQLRMGNVEPLQQFTQKEEARAWSEEAFLSAKPTPTYELRSEGWAEAAFRFITVDVQQEGVMWLLCCDWSKRGESRPVWFGKVFGEAEIQKKQAEFGVRGNNVLIDSGHEAKMVYGMCVRNGWIALKGDERKSWTHNVALRGGKKAQVERSYSTPVKGDPEGGEVCQGRRFAPLIWWSNPTIKNRFQRQRERGLVVFPVGPGGEEIEWVKELKRQVAGEWKKRIRNQVTGKFREVWCDNGENHGFDDYCMQVLAATLAKVLRDDPAGELEAGTETPAEETVVEG